MHEKEYNTLAAGSLGGVCLDRKLISTPLHHRGGIEPCDVFVPPGTLLHMKRGSSSASLSHLLAQGLVSADALARDEHARRAWCARIEEETSGRIRDAQVDAVVLGIQREKPITVESLFTFTKVNLVKQHAALRSLGVLVAIKTISS